MSFFKSLFSKKQPLPTRTLTQPSELQRNDIFKFSDSFALPEAMRKQQLQVIEINTIEFKHSHYAQLVAQGAADQLVYLSLPKNSRQQVKYSLLLSRAEVESLFDLEAFSEIFEEPGNATLIPITKSHRYGDMVASQYIQKEFMTTGYYHEADYRNSTPPQYNEETPGREFEYYSLTGDQEQRYIEIFIFENGDTDVYLSFFKNKNEITELWINDTEKIK
jgi:hypothetical protein